MTATWISCSIILVALWGCGSSRPAAQSPVDDAIDSSPGGAPERDIPTSSGDEVEEYRRAAAEVASLACAGDWSGFSKTWLVPLEQFVPHQRSRNPPEVDYAQYQESVRRGFEALLGCSEPVAGRTQEDGKRDMRGHLVDVTYKDAAGVTRVEAFRIYLIGGRLYAWDLD